MISPKYARQFIRPLAFGLIQLDSESLKDGLVHDFHRAICLGMADRCELAPNIKFDVEILESLVVKLSPLLLLIVWESPY